MGRFWIYVLLFASYLTYIGDSMVSNSTFAALDKNDQSSCARNFKGGWWYSTESCQGSINGLYKLDDVTFAPDGVVWADGFRGKSYSLRTTEMKLRPAYFLKCAAIEKK